MLLCDLPEVTIATMLEWCVGASGNSAYGLKRKLPLLAVCRQWRRIAIPLVHGKVFVQYGDWPKCGAGTAARKHAREEPTNVVVETNLDLIAVAGYAHAVKRVCIDLHCLINPLPGWREVIQRMRTVATKWCVVELAVDMLPDHRSYDNNAVDVAKYADDIAEVSDALAALMPDVYSLECKGYSYNPITRSLYGRLASHYADQLQRLDSHHLMSMLLDCQFMELSRFPTEYNLVDGYQLPQIASGELVDTRLDNGPPNHSRALFNTDSDSWAIEFPMMKRLRFTYNADRQENGIAVCHRDGHPWELHLPSLESLHIKCEQAICPLLEYAVLPPYMESITLYMMSADYLDMASVVLPETKRLSLRVSSFFPGDPSAFPAINRILKNARGSEVLELKIEDEMLRVGPESITCTALTHLRVKAPTSVDAMLAIIRALPNLVELTLKDLDLSDIQVDVAITEADKGAAVEPLHSSLQSLSIDLSGSRRKQVSVRAVAVLKYMLLRIPTLARVYSAEIPKEPVLDFVGAYAPRYPRLSSVVLNLYGR